jgi:hypothetical protein
MTRRASGFEFRVHAALEPPEGGTPNRIVIDENHARHWKFYEFDVIFSNN